MSNPYLPRNEYIPDGEPRVFGNRVYIYGSHDSAGSDKFCDTKLKVWSASVDNLNDWICHGDIFHTVSDEDHESDTPWTNGNDLFAPDVVEKDGKYYLYAYIMDAKGCVAVSDHPEGPFKLISKYEYRIPANAGDNFCNNGWFIDPGVLVDDDGRVYIYCGYQSSFAAELNAENMYEVIDGSYVDGIIPVDSPFNFFEACSPRKINGVYYLIYSNTKSSQLVYATSDSPMGPYTYRGVIIDNGVDYPGGNNHGSVCEINGQWYIFYHRMTNGTIMSRRGCVERIRFLEDGSIPQVEMTSLGFEKALLPYRATDADIACVLTGGCFVTEKDVFERTVSNITDGCEIGYKYFDFGTDYSGKTMEFIVKTNGLGCRSKLRILIDGIEEIGSLTIGESSGIYRTRVKCVQGVHSVFLRAENTYGGWFVESLKGRQLFELVSFLFQK